MLSVRSSEEDGGEAPGEAGPAAFTQMPFLWRLAMMQAMGKSHVQADGDLGAGRLKDSKPSVCTPHANPSQTCSGSHSLRAGIELASLMFSLWFSAAFQRDWLK